MASDSRPIYVQIAEQLVVRAKRRPKTEGSPTVRKVASQFGVSPVTASRALQLFRERLNDAATEGKANAKSLERYAICLHVSPGPHQHAAAELTAAGFRTLAQEGQATFDFEILRAGESVDETEIEDAVALAANQGVKGVFLLPARVSDEALRIDDALLAACRKNGLPVVLLERNLRGEDRRLSYDLVSFHDFEGGRLLTSHLLEQGRKRIAFHTGSPCSSHLERLAGYFSALHSAHVRDSLVIEQAVTGDVGKAYRDIVSQLIDWQADSVLCFHEHAAVGVIMELLVRGKTVPNDTAVAAFYSLGLGESFSIGITSYTFPAHTVAARALDAMRWRRKNRGSPPFRVMVPGELIIRHSSVPRRFAHSAPEDVA